MLNYYTCQITSREPGKSSGRPWGMTTSGGQLLQFCCDSLQTMTTTSAGVRRRSVSKRDTNVPHLVPPYSSSLPHSPTHSVNVVASRHTAVSCGMNDRYRLTELRFSVRRKTGHARRQSPHAADLAAWLVLVAVLGGMNERRASLTAPRGACPRPAAWLVRRQLTTHTFSRSLARSLARCYCAHSSRR